MSKPSAFEIVGTPPPWSVTLVDKFVVGALERVVDQGGELPERFRISFFPWGEHNAMGGTPEEVREVMDPRLRLVHFTGCGRPYLVVIFIGEKAENDQAVARCQLPWSEHFLGMREGGKLTLEFLGETEELETATEPEVAARTLRSLFHQDGLRHF
ncbi:MAG: hypothetical protein KDH88_04440 [Chromatiales bacterium]|nr:hypothetical protein [Chromatiales bacterium]